MDFKKKLDDFLQEKIAKQKIIVIYWPTASWKTWLSIDVAKYIKNVEVISTDSRQIFKYLDIGTWKITEEEKQWVIHHMLDIVEPNKEYSVWEFKVEAEKIIAEIVARWNIPILCWWTWLYIDSLIYDFNIPKLPADEKLRKQLEKEANEKWNEFVYKKLVELDPEYAKELHPNNIRYVIRALEVKMLTWKSKTEFREEKTLKYDCLFLAPHLLYESDWQYETYREFLYARINKRVGMMFDDWLVEEVKNLLKTYSKNDFGMRTIWYREVIDYLQWNWKEYNWEKKLSLWEKEKLWIKLNLEETISLVQKNNRNYAKKQFTWFWKYEK